MRPALLCALSLGCALSGCGGIATEDVGIASDALGACAYPASLEVVTVNIGQGDATIIATPSRIVLADVGETYWNSHLDALAVDEALTSRYGCRDVDTVVISHLQTDHVGYVGYGGLWYLVNVLGYNVGETLIRDFRGNVGTTSGTYDNWRAYLDTADGQSRLNPRTPTPGERLDLGDGISLEITNVDTRTRSCPDGWGSMEDLSCGGAFVVPSEVLGDHRAESKPVDENDFSIGFVLSLGDFDMYIGGDTDGMTEVGVSSTKHDIESYLARDVGEVDVLKVNHHGSDHSTNDVFASALDPQAAILTVGNANTFGHARQEAIDRLLAVEAGVPTRLTRLFFTERGDDGIGGCIVDRTYSDRAAAELYGLATIVSDTDGDYCTVEGGDVDIAVAPDGSTFTVEGELFVSRGAPPPQCNHDGVCDAGEDCAGCADDCVTPAGGCGNGVCEPTTGEDCLTCPADCNGVQDGKPSARFCCGGGGGERPVSCNDSRCSAGGSSCSASVPVDACCGDLVCEGGESPSTCSADCSTPPPPACSETGAACSAGSECCSGSCRGKKSKTCD